MDQPVIHTNKRNGFTLIELMIVVTVLAILTLIAYPSYVRYVKKANLSAAEQFMLTIANAENQYLLDARQYAADNGTPGAAVTALGLQEPTKVSENYTITVTSGTNPPTDYTIKAVAVGSATDGQTLTLDNTGAKGPASEWEQ